MAAARLRWAPAPVIALGAAMIGPASSIAGHARPDISTGIYDSRRAGEASAVAARSGVGAGAESNRPRRKHRYGIVPAVLVPARRSNRRYSTGDTEVLSPTVRTANRWKSRPPAAQASAAGGRATVALGLSLSAESRRRQLRFMRPWSNG